ncbi:MAG: hypothetical protein ABR860_04405 [Terracidiphilus sp.]
MTTLLAWVGVDQRGPASIRIAADSRISWSGATGGFLQKWDYGRKVFASQRHPDLIAYCGDVLFPTQTISQIVELIDKDAFFPSGASPEDKVRLIVSALEQAATEYPAAQTRDFSIVFSSRIRKGMEGTFEFYSVPFTGGKAKTINLLDIPNKSKEITILGSGKVTFQPYLERWRASDIGGTSRSFFSSFCEYLRSGSDPYSGGPPQLVGLFRVGAGRSFGVVWDGKLYLTGMEMLVPRQQVKFDCYNELFEICDAVTLQRLDRAQRQPSPFRPASPSSGSV